MKKTNNYFLCFPNGFKYDFIDSLNLFPNIIDFEIYEFSSPKLNSLERLFKLFKSDLSLIKTGKLNVKLVSIKIQTNFNTRLINREGKVYNCDSNLYDLIEFINNELQNDSYLVTQTVQQFYAIKSIIPKVNNRNLIGKNTIYQIKKDLIGTYNWDSLSELFQILNKSANWLILRNFEELKDTHEFQGDDLDILCEDLEYFAAIMNAKRRYGGRCSYFVSVNNQNIPLDIRFVGDKYIDPLWAFDMLRTKKFYKYIPVPSKYNYFFSLLYHSKLQKKSVKQIYIRRLDDLASQINFKNLPRDFVLNDTLCANILNSFLHSNTYRYTFTDDAVRNNSFLKLIKYKEINDPLNNWRTLIKKTLKVIIKKVIIKIEGILYRRPNFPKIY